MTPEEKAKELSIRFYNIADVFKPNFASKRMALKAVEEIISELSILEKELNLENEEQINYLKRVKNYYNEVLIEINKL